MIATTRWGIRIAVWTAITLTIFFLAASAFAQGVGFNNTAMRLAGTNLMVMPGALVTVCSGDVAAVFTANPPCTPLASIFSDVPLTQAIQQPHTADGLGNIQFFASPQLYTVVITDTIRKNGYKITWNAPAGIGTSNTWTAPQNFTTGTLRLLGAPTDPPPNIGLFEFRTDLSRLSYYDGAWRRLPALDTVDTLTNKTLTNPILSATSPTAAGALGYNGTGSITVGDGSTNVALVNRTAVETLSNKTLQSPEVSTGISQGSGLKHQRFGATCATAATAGATCTTIFSWTGGFADANYSVSCTGLAPTGTPAGDISLLPATVSITFRVTAITATPSSYGAVHCIAIHD